MAGEDDVVEGLGAVSVTQHLDPSRTARDFRNRRSQAYAASEGAEDPLDVGPCSPVHGPPAGLGPEL